MAIRLLKKDEIAKARSVDRAAEIAEGLKISHRVDSLRELMANEESALAKFRNESISAITKEINELIQKKDRAYEELAALEGQDLRKILEKKEKELSERKQKLDLLEIDIALTLKENKDSLERQRSHEEEARRIHRRTLDKDSESDQLYEKAQTLQRKALAQKEEAEHMLAIAEETAQAKRKEIEEQEENNRKIAQELEGERIRLADQRSTLERALERLRNNRLI